MFFYLDSSILEAKWLTAEEKDILARNLEAEEKHKTEVHLSDAFKSGKVWALCAIYFTLMIGLYGISFWLPTIVKAFGVKGYLQIGLKPDTAGARRNCDVILARLHYVINVSAGAIGLILSGVFASNPYLSIAFLSIGTLGVIGSMPVFWPIPSAFLAGTASAAGIGLVNSIGNLGGYVGPNVPIWAKTFSANPSAALYIIAADLLVGAVLTFFLIPANLSVRVGQAAERR